jgi:hypothetical protein
MAEHGARFARARHARLALTAADHGRAASTSIMRELVVLAEVTITRICSGGVAGVTAPKPQPVTAGSATRRDQPIHPEASLSMVAR